MNIAEFNSIVYGWIILAIVLVPIQLRLTAPYGRHTRKGWGPLIDNRLGWMIMEIVSPLVFGLFFLSGPVEKTLPMWIFFSLWMIHYINRSLIFPLRTRTSGKKIPLSIVGSAAFFNLVNGGLNGLFLGYFSESYTLNWLTDPRFLIGLLLFVTGFCINLWADHRLIHLRKPGEKGYKIPYGGLFNRISCPNHFGEVVEWLGFALLCWNLPALSFAIWTAANLIPRALSHHQWYLQQFSKYPKERKAVVPYFL